MSGQHKETRAEIARLAARNKAVRRNEEARIQSEIQAAIGALDGVLLLPKNHVGQAFLPGASHPVDVGMGPGSPDLIVILAPTGRLVGLEVKTPIGVASGVQRHVHAVWRSFGAFVAIVRSASEAIAALERARRGESE